MKISCPTCDSEHNKELINIRGYNIFKCSNCSLLFSYPLPTDDELISFYQGFLFAKPINSEIQKLTKKKINELIKLFNLNSKTKINNKIFLDWGGGTGIAYNSASQLGLISYYHDLDEQSIKFVQETFHLKNEYLIKNLKDVSERFDYIFADNVIEHDKNPAEFVKNLYNKLSDSGRLIIKTPHARNTETYFNPLISIKGDFFFALKYNSVYKAFKSTFITRYWHCDPPRHLYSFSEKSFISLMNKLGIKPGEYDILYYKVPLWKYTLTRSLFKDRIKGLKTIIFKFIIIPILPFEIISKFLHFIFLECKILTPGGITLKIIKNRNNK
jgi:SAM-dependent methyltransferase